MTTRDRDLAWAGIDMAGTNEGRMQQSGMTGTNSSSNDDRVAGEEDQGPPAGTGLFGPGTGYTEANPGRGSTIPTADLDQPELRNAQRGGQVFRPSDHYFVNGVDMGPSWDSAPGTGGPNKTKVKQP